ncbi:DNA mismatch repair protein msh6 [Phtheirospermum japonicum]|uniref:DNA mismatch repair protein msh6 n=1 Tax=Phtheirospermum japonicum TaxID=374723 RepID=A0A830CSH0_9LAMI|nr:DNA mismatch repair protein msh6 [Phtheirospermum japonicum]
MLDIEIEAVIVEMFQLFIDTIRSNHSSDIFNYMETIMTMIIEECDEVSLELLRPLLDSVRKENKGISPSTWELGKTVFEKCATKLEPCLREAVKQLNLNVDDYAEIVASICKVTSKGQNMVSESDEIPEAYQENFTTQLNTGNGLDDNNPTESAEIVLPRNNCTSSDIKPVNGAEIVQSEKGTGSHRTKRCRKPNSLLRPEEGYAHIWTRGRQGSSSVSHDRNNKAKEENKVVFGKRGRSNKEKHRGKIRCGITPQKDASGDVADKIVESHLAPEKDETFNGSNVEYGEEMVSARIKVWWPLDKTFYTGTVEAFDPLTKRHKIKYDDDEEEVLNLSEERWELFNERPQQTSKVGNSRAGEKGKLKKSRESRKA